MPGISRVVDDLVAQFFVSVGKLCADARVGQLTVCLRVQDGHEWVGVPEPPPETEADDELDSTGYRDVVSIGGVDVRLSDVVEASIRRPGHRSVEPSPS
jgi:hypothetical protein